MTPPPSVLVCLTTRDGRLDERVRGAVEMAIAVANAAGVRAVFSTVKGPYGVAIGRNSAVAHFLSTKFTHLLFVDDDVLIPPDAITRLVAVNTDISLGCYVGVRMTAGATQFYVVLLYLGKSFEDCYTAWPDGVVEVGGGGAGCMMIRRGVLEALGYPWFRWAGTYIAPAAAIVSMGEDIDFCVRSRAAGFHIFADGAVRCGHLKEVDLKQFVPG